MAGEDLFDQRRAGSGKTDDEDGPSVSSPAPASRSKRAGVKVRDDVLDQSDLVARIVNCPASFCSARARSFAHSRQAAASANSSRESWTWARPNRRLARSTRREPGIDQPPMERRDLASDRAAPSRVASRAIVVAWAGSSRSVLRKRDSASARSPSSSSRTPRL